MTFSRAVHMYGDDLRPYAISIGVLLFGTGWICGKYWGISFGDIFHRVLALLIIVNFIDAIIKSAVFAKNNFKLKLKLILSAKD